MQAEFIKFEGRYRFGLLEFSFDDQKIAAEFARAYQLCRRSDSPVLGSFVLRQGLDNHYLLESTFGHRKTGDLPFILGCVDGYLEEAIRGITSQSEISLHGSSCVVDGKAVCCVGESNVGKTTLSIAIANTEKQNGVCGYLGDEYAFVDTRTGRLSHERHPIQIKVDRQISDYPCVSFTDSSAALFVLSNYGVLTRACAAKDFNLHQLWGSFRLAAIIFPRFQANCKCASLDKTSISVLADSLMPSVAGEKERAALFAALVHLISVNGIKLFNVIYSDAREAAKLIVADLRSK